VTPRGVASERQRSFALSLAADRELPELGDTTEERVATVARRFDDGLGRADASRLIAALLGATRAVADVADAVGTTTGHATVHEAVKPGVYQLDDVTYVVKPNRDKTRLYAMRLVNSPPRLMESGDVAKLELEYARGLIFQLTGEHRLPAEEVAKISRVYGRCLYCGHGLKAAASVERMIGPVCWKRVS
jgi:hypothetical protein